MKKAMSDDIIDPLIAAIHDLHGCQATWATSVSVKETFQGQTVWDGIVQVFDLVAHPTASRCYAWSHAVDDSENRRFVAVLHQRPVDSAAAAVRAAIVQEQREGKS